MSALSSASAEGSDTLHAETAPRDGSQATIVRDAAGNIVYPSYVPPETQSPTSPPAAKRSATELPQQRDNTPAVMRRAGTDISGMGQVMRGREDKPDSDSSESESSSDEDERTKQARKTRKKPVKRKKKADDEERYRRFRFGNEHYRTKGRVKSDGRLSLNVLDTSTTGYLAKAVGQAARKMVPLTIPTSQDQQQQQQPEQRPQPQSPAQTAQPTPPPTAEARPPRLNIVIMVIGSRGDAQPFLKIASLLRTEYGHRVRIATHPAFREFVNKGCPGVEFFSVGGDPAELMAFMVKNPGMIPTVESIKQGDIQKRRGAMRTMFQGFWRACINASDGEGDVRNVGLLKERDPFVADVIIANPPSFAHVHCAEALGIPVHLMFTFPYTPTQAFPHPLARIKMSNVEEGYTNWISYPLVEMMVWQGLGDLVNEFRVKTLGLDPVSTLWAPGATYRLHVPFTYLWSPALVPKPPDWGDEVEVAGFVFLDLGSSFDPPEALSKFFEEGDEPPIYIGFGSIVVDAADRFTEMIFEAVKMAGVRALVSKGWGGLGGDSLDVPPEVYLLDNVPHDWLFPRVRACVIHGGAGTTAIALKCGKPTMIVPFFGDQHFWGSMVGNAGAGPEPVPYKNLTAEKLADGIKYCITGNAREAAERIARDIEKEGDGAMNACKAFHRHLVLQGKGSMRCSLLPDQVAVWQMKKTGLRLSAMAAQLLVERGLVSWKKLRLMRHTEWNDFEGPGEPLTGVAGSLMTSVGGIFGGIGGVPYRIGKFAKKRREKKKQKRGKDAGADDDSGGSKQKPGASKPDGNPSQQNGNVPQIETTTTHAIDHGALSRTATDPAEEVVRQVGRGAAKTAAALARTPVDLLVALVQGFHNAPRLYGDDTVRRPTRVTGIRSGLRAARREFVYGIYDGWTGVVRLPVRGAREDGLRGLISGVGMGLTGFILKDIAAIIGLIGYPLKGVVRQLERRRQPSKYIRRARVVQGRGEVNALAQEEKAEKVKKVIAGWKLMRRLWIEMKRAERRKAKGFGGRLSGSARRLRMSREWNTVFENVEVAQRALHALEKDERLDHILEEGSETAGESSPDPVKDDIPNGKVSPGIADDSRASVSAHDSAHDIPAEKNTAAASENEDENPFSTATPAIVENKLENKDEMAELDLRAAA
ncbi:sterol 3-beta-glucosyltransferase [Achaetomium macrosporum]|uniref:Sterol 3-beta-glucosyltransferase n=1 Tax=Achaetomium macrosporum TaxID=79813 RepID=A0AAN7CD54_9PEZI|nr:sterol 3-beta-glucosyltransferase [Achaetomium macrosporum]